MIRQAHGSHPQHAPLVAPDHKIDTQAASPAQQAEEDLLRRVKIFLAGRSMPALRRLKVTVEGNCVSLHGMVRTYYEKQLAVTCCQRVAGVINVVDGIEVENHPHIAAETY
jgi:osmotically-inducible protein OsmY